MGEPYSNKILARIKDEFSWIKDKCYLDHAGAGLYSSKQVEDGFHDLCHNVYGNPHSGGYASKLCDDVIDQVRERILAFFHTTSENYSVIFTSGATAAIKLVIENFQWNECPESESIKGCYVYTNTNHTSIVGGRLLAADAGADVLCLPDQYVQDVLNKKHSKIKQSKHTTNSLFAYPAQCNFSGKKFPLKYVKYIQEGALSEAVDITNTNWYCLLDAATFCATNNLDLSDVAADFVCVSFYKIFGYPTGVGALLVRNDKAQVLRKRYFGGGSVDISIPSGRFLKMRTNLHKRFEDGTLPFLSIVALSKGFDTLSRIGLTMHQISSHVFHLAMLTIEEMRRLRHWNGSALVEVYTSTESNDISKQGGIVSFNLKRSDGSYIGYIEVLHVANLNLIQLRTGCFCNVGACQLYLNLTDDDLLTHYQTGHVCGDERDLVAGRPTGAVRISFGYSSTTDDSQRLVRMLKDSFLETKAPINCYDIKTVSLQPRLQSIRLYPIKSCGPMIVTSWRITRRGLEYDRQWMVVNANGVALTQKQEPLLCKILPSFDTFSNTLKLTFSGDDPITLTEENQEKGKFGFCKSKVCGDGIDGEDCGDEVADWLLRHLQRKGLRLIRQMDTDGRTSKIGENRGRTTEDVCQLSLANQAQYLLINADSVAWLRERVTDEPELNCDTFIDRFRANLIINGVDALEEVEWVSLKIGEVDLKVEGPCTRCQMICIDQATGQKNRRPLVELSRALAGKLRFGIYCSNSSMEVNHVIKVGDEIVVTK